MTRLAEATGVPIPQEAEAAMYENLKRFHANADHCPFAPEGTPGHFDLASLREGMLALNARIKYYDDPWTRGESHAMASSLLDKLNEDGTWRFQSFDVARRYPEPGWGAKVPTSTHGRTLEALVWNYELTSDPVVLRLGDRIARHNLQYATSPDGSMNMASGTEHTHSYLGTLRASLACGGGGHDGRAV